MKIKLFVCFLYVCSVVACCPITNISSPQRMTTAAPSDPSLARMERVVASTVAPIVVHPPNPSDGQNYVNQDTLPLFNTTISIHDIRQGQIGDCYFLSDLAAIAWTKPASLRQLIIKESPNVYRVGFQRNGVTTWVYVNADIPSNTDQVFNGCIWVPIAEKAYAYFRTGANTYASLNQGFTGNAFSDLGFSSTSWLPTASGWTTAKTAVAVGWPVSTITPQTMPPAVPLIGNHSYAVISVNADTSITLQNPWGWYPALGTPKAVVVKTPADGLTTITQALASQGTSLVTVGTAFTAPSPLTPPTPPPVVYIPGDANRDGKVDGADLGILVTNYNKKVPTGVDGWTMGDFNGSRMVDGVDLGILVTHYGQHNP